MVCDAIVYRSILPSGAPSKGTRIHIYGHGGLTLCGKRIPEDGTYMIWYGTPNCKACIARARLTDAGKE